MGGIGKTTLAKVLYNNLSSQFEHRSFLTDIRETCARKGIECLQKQLICDILRTPCDVSNVEEGIGVIRSRFTSKKVLIVLDDVDDDTHLNALAGESSSFEAGSMVIITTRNKSILEEATASPIYQLKELPSDQSLILFSRYAFRKDSPQSDYEVISGDVASTTGGLPLALKVIGSFLCGKGKEVWEDTLKKLKKVPHIKVQEKLKISYDALNPEEQQIFLDIACFFIGWHKQSPTYMWDACEFFPATGIEVLSLLSLIEIDESGNLMMHDQLRDLGREIVRQENAKEPWKWSRLWNHKDAEDVVDNSKGTRKIEALCLWNYGEGGRSYTAEQFKELANLRFFQMNGGNFTGDFQNLLPQLRWLQWQDCPSDFAAANFHPKKLVVLDLSYSDISEDWGGWGPLKVATELKVLNLTWCWSLKGTPDLSAFKSLEILILENCSGWKRFILLSETSRPSSP
ncbi:disease resistance protein L6-like [Rhodamnia argentea]|uniref:Disease resistance protein L6-like n=1 Tax=Rhodamnia argentea TaxID=178133 RepID=A0ABM3HMT0_9MYRT|nr:disease resistance protein L6-like [Rhodamnia argentea]